MQRNFIRGEWVDSPQHSTNINPSDTRDTSADYAHTCA